MCTPCDHYMRAAGASAADRLKIKEAVEGGPEHEEYMDGVGKWVEKFNGSQLGYVLKTELGKGHSIFKENRAGTRSEVVTGFLGPLKDFEAHVKRKAKKGEVSVHEGARGVMRNSSHDCPDGCANIYAYKDRSIGERKEEGDAIARINCGQASSSPGSRS